ncbi:CHAT domain-containing protein [Rhodococcus sp. ZPP]|uniref:CHAT domain-containing protein n=1 Tax=Rhodococcus sp. ZPP TaxID=2749906 RepID=UPI001AD89A6E|nr:CHAT domain-containing protein [Rhodococcus sp. ZPP]QTJ68013.1 CHAT domain-containing protein [Rhodococcus sp. ZPP]
MIPLSRRSFEELEISVLEAGDHMWLSARSPQGSVFAVKRPLPEWKLPRDVTGRPVDEPGEWLTDAVRHARPDAGPEALEVGKVLTDLVFGVPEIVTLLQQTRGTAGTAGNQLLIRILAAPNRIAAWPWELLLDPQRPDRFLSMARDVHVVRSGRSRTYPIRQAPIDPPLNLLLVMSSPLRSGPDESEAPFDLYAEKRSLLTELQPMVDRGLLRVVVEDRPSVERLRTRMGMQRRGFHLFHYLGHANPHGLKLERRNGRGTLLRSQEFALLLQQLPDLRLAVFAGCETARAPGVSAADETWPGQLSSADYCVRDACPMVIGMQAVLPFGTERLFTRFFYQGLTAGQSVAEALRLARLAINGDENSGDPLLNWAVPCLFVGGSDPGAVIDPDAKARPRPAPRKVSRHLGVRQGELRFISRLTELREAVDVLSGNTSARLLQVVGMPATGKTSLLDRVLEELDPDIAQLFISAKRLLAEPEPVRELACLVKELIDGKGLRAVPAGRFSADDWWERLIGDLGAVPAAIVIDDADLLAADSAGASDLVNALVTLTGRRGRARLAVATTSDLDQLTQSLRPSEVRTIRLEALSWPEVWQWIRRNLPTLTRFSETELSKLYGELRHLELWEQLADLVGQSNSFDSDDLPALVKQVAVPPGKVPAVAAIGSDFFGTSAELESVMERVCPTTPVKRPLQLAVAGPFTARRRQEVTVALTQCAINHGVPGRVVAGETGVDESALAELLSHELAFTDGAPSEREVCLWLEEAGRAGADIIVLDYGNAEPTDTQNTIIADLVREGRLVIASGDHSDEPSFPAWSTDVLAVGAVEDDGSLTHETPYFSREGKPDIYAPRTISGTTCEQIVEEPEMEGTTFAALYVAAAAMLVWATDRNLTASEVRALLLDTAVPIPAGRGESAKRLDMEAALDRARRRLIVGALGSEALELGQLLAETPIRPELAVPILDALVAEGGAVRKVVRNGVEQFERSDSAVTPKYE